MRYLLSYKDFGKLVKEWEVVQQQEKIKLQRGNGLTDTDWISSDIDGFYDYVAVLICSYGYGEVSKVPIDIKYIGTSGDSFQFTIPKQYHDLPVYNVKFMGKIYNCVLVTEEIYKFFKKIGIV